MEFTFRRRDFLKGLLSSGAAVMGGCSPSKPEKIIPYVIPPDDSIPGVSKWFSSVCRECPAGCGVMVRQREGRALKVEGNPDHPVNGGGLCMRGQASLEGLYNPDRFKQPYARNASGKMEAVSWKKAVSILTGKLQELRSNGKISDALFLTGHATGSRSRLIDSCSELLGMKPRVTYEPFSYEPLKAAAETCFGRKEIPVFALDKAAYLLNFGADILETWISPVQYTKDLSRMRQNASYKKSVHVEPRHSLTAAGADEWISIRPGTEVAMILGIGREVLQSGAAKIAGSELTGLFAPYTPEMVAGKTDVSAATIKKIARELVEAEGPTLVLGPGMAGGTANAADAWVAAYLLNHILGNINETVLFGLGEKIGRVDTYATLRELTGRMRDKKISLLMLHETNPVYSLPKASGFKEALEQVPFVVSFSTVPDETSEFADLILPDHAWLERWDDYESRDGWHALIQPAMDPVTGTRHFGDIMLEVCQKVVEKKARQALPWKTYYDYLRDVWKRIHAYSGDPRSFEDFWDGSLRSGGHFRSRDVERAALSSRASGYRFQETAMPDASGKFSYYPYPSLCYFDGRSADRQWLLEAPDPITCAVWDSWVEIHPSTAKGLGIERGDLLKVTSPHGEIKAPAYLYEGIRPDTLGVQAGLGHAALGRYAMNVGVNAVSLLPSGPEKKSGSLPWLVTTVSLQNTGEKYDLVTLDGSLGQEDRGMSQTITRSELAKGGEGSGEEEAEQIYSPHEHPTYDWSMAVDLDKCVGCGACAVACYAENNIAVVGKKLCGQGREMSWMRIERYFREHKGGAFHARFLPMMCQQCHNAGCEPVCPVYATYHNKEGLNVQVYNRCVGTRYCSNNCSYKVRRFNWYGFRWEKPLDDQLNPDISVREMGVMEKCTFCLQRIWEGKDAARDRGEKVPRDGEIKPACVQSCPAGALTFGNLKDPKSAVSKQFKDPRGYRALEVLNLQPSVKYLKRVIPDSGKEEV